LSTTESYTVRLDVFQGPLDLLLHLIKRAELDISVISIATITDQFMSHIERIDEVDIDTAGEFLLIASTLLEIKSRTVMPVEDDGTSRASRVDDESEDSAAVQLLSQLLEYKRFRDAADVLESRRDRWEMSFPAERVRFDKASLKEAMEDDSVELEDIELYDLVQAFQRIMDTVVFDRLGDHEVMYDDTPIGLHQADLIDRLERLAPEVGGKLRLRQIFEGRNKSEMIGLFLALLELVKQRRLNIVILRGDECENGGDGVDEEIVLSLRPPEDRDLAAEDGTASPEAWEDDHIFGDDEEPDDDED